MGDGLPAMAQQAGYYVSGAVGPTFPNDSSIAGGGIDTKADLDVGPSLAVALGYAYGNGLRAEIELGWRQADVDSLSGAAGGSGDVDVWNLMINGYYDVTTATPFTPYLGLGLGVARLEFGDVRPVGGSRLDDGGHAFAYQGIAGVSYRLGDNVDLFADYRYFATLDADLTTDSGVGVDGDYADHRVMLGLRWNFGAPKRPAAAPAAALAAQPAPPPPPAPAPQPAPQVQAPPPVQPATPAPQVPRTFLLFFDWDKADLRPDALAVVRAAADNARQARSTRIVATGHADRSGPEAYNMRLSQRRAQAVKAELVRLGVAERDIAIVAKGEQEPLVPTPDGVREAQNRRVEIVFQ